MNDYIFPYEKEIVKLRLVTTGYNDRKSEKIVSKDISVSISNGELVSLIGANGCGKSTLMRCIGGLQSVLGGDIQIKGKDVSKMSSMERARSLSLVLTDQIEATNLTVYDIVSNGRYPHIGYLGKLSENDWMIIDKSLDICFLRGWGDRIYSSLSDGEKQRALIARALSQDTPLMLLDEPTAHLDLPNRVEMMRMLNELAKKTGKAILISTHELDLVMQWSDTIWLMNTEGRLIRGIPEDIVLSAKISECFSNKNIFFDMQLGNFKSNKENTHLVTIQGEGIRRIWTERALERIGFVNTDISEGIPIITVFEDNWKLSFNKTEQIYYSLEDILGTLRTDNYWHSILK